MTVNSVAIALGSNLGNSTMILNQAIDLLSVTPGLYLTAVSPWYKTAPVGPPQPDYVNGCAIFDVDQSPADLLQVLLTTEQHFGRIRRVRWGPRSLDLDLLFYGDRILQLPNLTVPHPRMRDRAFVLAPLADIAPHWRDPVTQTTVAELLAQVDCSGITRLAPV
jgi:2-amino-4-hydroxy-6-hydroxymethyldihydropteridine diphosphokinase